MLKSRQLLIGLVLLTAVVCAGAAFASANPQAAASGAEAQSSGTLMYWLAGSELPVWLRPELDPIVGPTTGISLNCTQYNNSYCLYKLDKPAFCCRPYWISPGAYCPNICI